MPTDIERISGEIARSPSFDGYSLWRMLKDVNNQMFTLQRKHSPIPIELARLRAIFAKAQELRQKRDRSRDAVQPRFFTALPVGNFDAFDFVDHYRSLGGRRVALDTGCSRIDIRQWNVDTQEATAFWTRGWTALGPRERSAVAVALLIRGIY